MTQKERRIKRECRSQSLPPVEGKVIVERSLHVLEGIQQGKQVQAAGQAGHQPFRHRELLHSLLVLHSCPQLPHLFAKQLHFVSVIVATNEWV